MFNTFFTKYEMQLALEHGSPARAQQGVAETTAMTALTWLCKQQVLDKNTIKSIIYSQ